jgi:uncharacterized protein
VNEPGAPRRVPRASARAARALLGGALLGCALWCIAAAAPARAASPSASASMTPPAAPTRWATDDAGFLSEPTRAALDARLAGFEGATHHQVLLWIGHTSGGDPIEDWAARAFAAWKVGRHGLDDGAVLFILADDRKLRIEVGYGLEDKLTDVQAARIIREIIVPRVQAGDRDGAARAGVGAILAAVGGEIPGANPDAQPRPQLSWGAILLMGLLGIGLLAFAVTHPSAAIFLFSMFASGRGGGRGGGGWGGGGGGGGFSGGGGGSGGGGASGSW